MIILLLIGFLLTLCHFTTATMVSARAHAGCALLMNTIHCFGGYLTPDTSSTDVFLDPSTDHFTMNLSRFDFKGDVSAANSNWSTVIPSPSATVVPAQPLGFLNAAAVNNQSLFMIYGGASKQSVLLEPIMVYDPSRNQWSNIPTYGNYTRFGTIVDLGQSTLWTWGGQINNTWTASAFVNILNYATQQWTQKPMDPSNSYTRYHHTATLVESLNTIYIIGGINTDANRPNATDVGADMLDIRTFQTLTNTWGSIRATGRADGKNITSRSQHTATLVPNTNKILIYGGDALNINNANFSSDYAYFYDYKLNQYTPLTFKNGVGAGIRKGHNAIIYQSYIMIFFGVNMQNELLADVNVLDVSNITRPIWVDNPGSSSGPFSDNDFYQDAGLSKGAIAGIAVAAVAVAIGVIVAVIFVIRRKKRAAFQGNQHQSYQHQPHQNGAVAATSLLMDNLEKRELEPEGPPMKYDAGYRDTLTSPSTKPFEEQEMINQKWKPDNEYPANAMSRGKPDIINEKNTLVGKPDGVSYQTWKLDGKE